MQWPWVSRALYREMVDRMTADIAEMRAERKLLLDRLASLGLGGPIFYPLASPPEVATEEEEDEPEQDLESPEAMYEDLKQRYRNRPTQLAEALTRLGRQRRPAPRSTQVAWARQAVVSALDSAEQVALKG
jgi:hypothetical protein